MIHLARCIEQAWRRTIEATATEDGAVAELARLNADVPLDAEMGDLALEMLARVLDGEFEGFEPWDRDSLGRYCRDLNDVTMIYDPDSHRLAIETRLSEMVSAEAQGAAEASGFTVGEVAAEAAGKYYDDGWGGRTKERAVAEAQAEAERRVAEAVEALHREQNAPAMAAAESEAQANARARAREALEARQAEVRAALHERMQATLARSEARVYHVMNRAVGEAYRQSLLRVVRENGGRVLRDEETGSVINMELELY
jgi:hypothetical protein